MAFFKRSALKEKGLTDEQIEYVLTESGRLIADYIPKSEMNEKLEEAKNAVPDFHDSDEWKEMVNANSALTAENAKIKALSSDDFAGVKNQYRDILWDKLDHGEKAKPISEQISGFRETMPELFITEEKKPAFGAQTHGEPPKGNSSFGAYWNYKKGN